MKDGLSIKKFNILLFCLFAIGITAYGLVWPNYIIHSLIGLNETYVQVRSLLIAILFFYTFFPQIRSAGMKVLAEISGSLSLMFGIITLFSPMFLGYFNEYVLLGDVFIFLEGGILTLLAATTLPRSDIQPQLPAISHSNLLTKLRMIYNPSIRGGT